MIPLDDLIAATEAEVVTRGVRSAFGAFAHDSRILAPGECFVAVRGMRGDGHDFVADAVERGAGAIVIERARRAAIEARDPGFVARVANAGASLLVVEDTRAALKRYAAHILARWRPTVIAVTGGVGKTTTKEAIAEVLSGAAPTFRSWRNFNDLLGLPLSLGRLEPSHRYAILELAADHPGEIAELCALIHPQIGVVTNSALTQLQYFGDEDAYRAELASLPAALPEDGLAILNADDEATPLFASQTTARVSYFAPITFRESAARTARLALRYQLMRPYPFAFRRREPEGVAGSGMGEQAGDRYRSESVSASGAISADRDRTPFLVLAPMSDGGAAINFPQLLGGHWAYAVLAALTVGAELGVDAQAALTALQAMRPLPGRLRRLGGVDGLTLLDDSHNATLASATAGLNILDLYACGATPPRRRIAALGDMLRLGDQEEAAHRELGRLAATHADYLVTRGLRAELIAEAAIQAGLPAERVAVTHTAEDAARAVRQFAAAPTPGPSPEGRGGIVGREGWQRANVDADNPSPRVTHAHPPTFPLPVGEGNAQTAGQSCM
jgi:alanine racemase